MFGPIVLRWSCRPRMGWGVKRLNGMDAMLLYSETPNLHTHTLKVAIIHAADYCASHDGEFTFDVFRRTIQRRLHLLDPLRYRLVGIPWKASHPVGIEEWPGGPRLDGRS